MLKAGETMVFYGQHYVLLFDKESMTPYIQTKEEGTVIDMPIMPGDEIGFRNYKTDRIDYREYSGFLGSMRPGKKLFFRKIE